MSLLSVQESLPPFGGGDLTPKGVERKGNGFKFASAAVFESEEVKEGSVGGVGGDGDESSCLLLPFGSGEVE